jgi:hypothetical protein
MWCGRAMDGPPVANRPPSPDLFSAYKSAFLKPSSEGMASEVSGASWGRVWLGLGISMGAGLLANALTLFLVMTIGGFGGLFSAVGAWRTLLGSNVNTNISIDPIAVIAAVIVWFALSVGIFFLGSLYLYWLCGRFGGSGRTEQFGEDFKTHTYLLTLATVPAGLVGDLLLWLPLVGSAAVLAAGLYSYFLQYNAIRASMQMTRNQGQLTIIVYVLSGFIIGAIVGVVIFFLVISFVANSVFSNLGSGLR